jgi:hypothetical protein
MLSEAPHAKERLFCIAEKAGVYFSCILQYVKPEKTEFYTTHFNEKTEFYTTHFNVLIF